MGTRGEGGMKEDKRRQSSQQPNHRMQEKTLSTLNIQAENPQAKVLRNKSSNGAEVAENCILDFKPTPKHHSKRKIVPA